MKQVWFDPVLFGVGPFQLRWYGAMYVLGFLVGVLILRHLARKQFWPLPTNTIEKFITLLIVAMFLGARFFYVFIYNWEFYALNPLDILAFWKGGLSFHGAPIGMCLASWYFARGHDVHFFQISDCMALAGAPGLFFGRMGNFINGELYGRVTDSWIGMVFPEAGPFPRHPSQLYEGVFEGVVLFFVLFYVHKRQRFYGVVSATFLAGYALFRFTAEFFREPDPQLGYLLKWFTLGQLLCLPMLLVAFFVLKKAKTASFKNPLTA